MKTWNIGNTTVRNPSRIREGLRVLRDEFLQKEWTSDAEEQYFSALVSSGVYSLSGASLASTSRGQSGRKWASVFNQLGFARVWRKVGRVEITPVGDALIAAVGEDEIGEVFLRQLLKYHLPSAIEHDGKFDGFNVSPFWLFLRLMVSLKQSGEPGLTKEEIGLFLITTTVDSGNDQILERLRSYRAERNALLGRVAKNRYDGIRRREIVEGLYAEEAKAKYGALASAHDASAADPGFIKSDEAGELLDRVVASGKGSRTKRAMQLRGTLSEGLATGMSLDELWVHASTTWAATKGRSLIDYADTAVRYFALTGLISITGSRVVLRENSVQLALQLLEQGPGEYHEEHYLAEFYDPALPILPSDDVAFLVAQYEVLRTKVGASAVDDGVSDPRALKRQLSALRSQLVDRQEQEFYLRQRESIGDIETFFEEIEDGSLLGGNAYRPAFYEWNIWRCFLAVNEITGPISKTRGFKIDEEIYPVHHAAGGEPDMVFSYRHGILVVEATLSTGENQWSREQEPVQRHVKALMSRNPSSKVIGVFVAPKVNINTALNFRQARGWFEAEGEKRLNIIPITTDQLRTLMRRFESEGFRSEQMFSFFARLLDARDEAGDAVHWLREIDDAIRVSVIA